MLNSYEKSISILAFALMAANGFCMKITPYYSALRAEANNNSRDHIAAGAGIDQFYSLSAKSKAGTSFVFSSDFTDFTTTEFLLAYDYLSADNLFGRKIPLFTGVAAGVENIFYDGDCSTKLNIGAEAKVVFVKKQTCIIPFVRLGFPYLFSLGVSMGVMF